MSRLEEIVNNKQKQLNIKLEEIRSKFSHPGVKGTTLENEIRSLVGSFLPSIYSIGTGQIIDSDSAISKQIDIIITNERHPRIGDPNNPDLFFIEGVCGAGEVKTKLTRTDLESAIENCRSFKKLNEKPVNSLFVGGSSRIKMRPPYFVFAMESELSYETILKILTTHEPDGSIDNKQGPDIIYISNEVLFVDPRGTDKIQVLDENKNPVNSWIQATKEQSSFFDFLMLLLSIIPIVYQLKNFMTLYSNIKKLPEK